MGEIDRRERASLYLKPVNRADCCTQALSAGLRHIPSGLQSKVKSHTEGCRLSFNAPGTNLRSPQLPTFSPSLCLHFTTALTPLPHRHVLYAAQSSHIGLEGGCRCTSDVHVKMYKMVSWTSTDCMHSFTNALSKKISLPSIYIYFKYNPLVQSYKLQTFW